MAASPSNLVCVAIDYKYSDNNGAWNEYYMWDGERCTCVGSMYNKLDLCLSVEGATPEEIRLAAEYMNKTRTSTNNYNKYANNGLGADTYVGCIVKLKRSRKAPNNIELRVVDFNDRHYSSAFRNWVDEKITLIDANEQVFEGISTRCIDEVVQGIKEDIFFTPTKP